MEAVLTTGAEEQTHKTFNEVKHVLTTANSAAVTETFTGKRQEQWHFMLVIK